MFDLGILIGIGLGFFAHVIGRWVGYWLRREEG